MSDLHEVRKHVQQLYHDLQSTDPDQDVMGWAIPVMQAVLDHARTFVPSDHPIHHSIVDLMSTEMIEGTPSLRAFDARIVVGQLRECLPHPEQPPNPHLPPYLR